jgi:hypothetical protein
VRSVSAVAIAVLLACVLAVGQQSQPAPAPARPTQEQMMMNYFSGDWTLTGTTKVSPKTPGAPFTGTEHGAWVPGGYFLETHSVMKGPMGDVHGTRVMEYNPLQKVYTYNAYNSLGEHTMAEGTVQGATWVWNSEEKMNGVVVKGRYTVTFVSPDSYSFTSEVQKPDGGWSSVSQGMAKRSPAAQ